MTHDTYGPRFCDAFAWFDPDTQSLRTCEVTLFSDSTGSSPTLPPRGSMRNGWLYERQMSAPPTDGHGCSSLLATPMAHPRTHTARRVDHGIQLANQLVELLPTPTASQPGGTAEQMLERKARMADGPRSTVTDLRMVVELLPTPTARDGKAGPDYRDRTQGDDLYQAAARIGGHMNPRSGDGNESSDVPLPFH